MLENFRLYNPPSEHATVKHHVIDTDVDGDEARLQNYRASQKTHILGIISQIHARVLREELSTPFKENVPDAPDYFGQEEFVTAYQYESLLESLDKLSRPEIDEYFKKLGRSQKWDLREQAFKTRKYWRKHPEIRFRYFPNAGRSIEWYSSCSSLRLFSSCPFNMRQTESMTRTELSPDVVEGGSPGQLGKSVEAGLVDTHGDLIKARVHYNSHNPDLSLHAPKPCRRQNIAANIEKIVEQFNVASPTTAADHRGSVTTRTQQDSYRYHQRQRQLRQNALLERRQQNAQQQSRQIVRPRTMKQIPQHI